MGDTWPQLGPNVDLSKQLAKQDRWESHKQKIEQRVLV